MIHVVDARHVAGHRVWIRFDDGLEGEIDLANELGGEVFEPLKEPGYFASLRLEGHTLTWPNGADFAPEYLRGLLESQRARSGSPGSRT
jgi:hypothetical protein